MPAPYDRAQQSTPGNLITLFDINMSPLGAGIYHFVPGNLGDRKPRWRGNEYEPIPVAASGFEKNGQGQQPTPTLTLPATELIVASVIGLDDLRRSIVTRWQVFEDNLDNGANPSDTYFPPDIYMIQRKVRHNTATAIIEWELSTALDLWGTMIPKRVATQRTCLWQYRLWNGSGFDYSDATCPYAGNSYFNEDDQPVANPAQDKCSKTLNGCKLRFAPQGIFTRPLPFGGFPGVGRSS